MSFRSIKPSDIPSRQLYAYLSGSIAPRPIAFVSTVDKAGNANLSPFSYFNVFSTNPPVLIFAPARRGRNGTNKDTYHNVKETGEAVVNIVSYAIVEQMSLSSTEYDRGVNEFVKSGLTEAPSDIVRPPRVGESQAAFECKVLEVKELGDTGGAGNLVICEIVNMHLNEEIIDDNDRIDPYKLDAVARLGGNYYCRAQGEALFEVKKPTKTLGIGVDQLPANIRNSEILTGNDLGKLGNVELLPTVESVKIWADGFEQKGMLSDKDPNSNHQLAKEYLNKGDLATAWNILMYTGI